jgi:glycosyltransferase involved in cell wall biosynthesis
MKPLVLASSLPTTGEGVPRSDILRLAEALGADITYPESSNRVERALGLDVKQARAAHTSEGAPVLSLSEKVGLPLALLGARRRHIVVAHHLTSGRKRLMQAATGWLRRLDGVVVLCREQERYLLEDLRLPADRVHFVYDKVDARFFSPAPEGMVEEGLVVSVGRERRDWATLTAAVRRLPEVRCTVVSSSPWSRQGDPHLQSGAQFSALSSLSYADLRTLYARAAVVVIPLEAGVRYAAGVNALLEARAMGRPVIATHTPGIADYLEGIVSVPASDPVALADAIEAVLSCPPDTAPIRRFVDERANLESYVAAVTRVALG